MQVPLFTALPIYRVQLTGALLLLCWASLPLCVAAAPQAGVALQQAAPCGRVVDDSGQPLAGANILIIGTQQGVYADAEGRFCLPAVPDASARIRISFPGYMPRTLGVDELQQVQLEPLATDAVVVTGNPSPMRLADSPMKVEIIEGEALQQSGSSTLMESLFATNGVTEGVSCGVCGTSDLHINGLDGAATLFMIDGMPIMGSLAAVYGLNSLPVSLIDRVEIVKGPASTLYGAEAIGGVVNVITLRPDAAPRLRARAWGNTHAEANLDLLLKPRIAAGHSLLLAANGYRMQQRLDDNGDGFTDVPLNDRASGFVRWQLNRTLPAVLTARGYYEDRFGGVLGWKPTDRGSSTIYGESIRTRRIELLGRYGLGQHWQLDASSAGHWQNSYYGDQYYKALQYIGFANLLHNRQLGAHHLTFGLANRYQVYDDNTPATARQDSQWVPGLFVEDRWQLAPRWAAQLGLRADHHAAHGLVPAPRFNLKWELSALSSLRLNTGTGFRTVHVFTEDHAALTGARRLEFADNLKPERSVSASLGYATFVALGDGVLGLTADAFYTRYENRLIPDYSEPDVIRYANRDVYAITRGLALGVDWQLLPSLHLNLGTTVLDTYERAREGGADTRMPILLAPRYTANWALNWQYKAAGIELSWQGKVFGPMQLPSFPEPHSRPSRSEVYSLQSLQLDKSLGRQLSLFIGVRNLLDYTQPSPLIDPRNPFGPDFDTAYAYGPTQRRRFFAGLNWTLP